MTDTLSLTPENAGVSLDGEKSSWMHTCSGKRFYPFAPRVEDVDIEDIAHALSNQCRYNGHCDHFYSVTQHSYLGAQLALKHYGKDIARQFLLHDAPEAYIGDMIRPMKVYFSRYVDVEAGIWQVVAEKFDLPKNLAPEVKYLDNIMCMWEKRDLLPNSEEWLNMPPLDPFLPLPSIWANTPIRAKDEFLNMYETLF